MSRAKFYADPLKTVAVHKEQRTDRIRYVMYCHLRFLDVLHEAVYFVVFLTIDECN